MSLFEQYFVNVIRDHYADFDGRARRKEYWMFALFGGLISLAITLLFGFVSESLGTIVSSLFSLAIFLPNIGVSIRRLHDTGKSGWFLLIILVPIIGFIYLIYIAGFKEGDHGPNEYGEDPKDPYNDMDEIEDFERVLGR